VHTHYGSDVGEASLLGREEVMIREGIQAVVEGRNLTEAEAIAVMREIMEGSASPAQIAAFIVGLRWDC
jgi:anthranilate phosphoribosyltransferase